MKLKIDEASNLTGKRRNNNNDYHDMCRDIVFNNFILGDGKIVGVTIDGQIREILISDASIKEDNLYIDDSNHKCDIFCLTSTYNIYVEIVNTNREILKYESPKNEKMNHYRDKGAVVILIDVEELIERCHYKEDDIKRKTLELISTPNKEKKVLILDFSDEENLPVIHMDGNRQFKVKEFQDQKTHFTVTNPEGVVIAVPITKNFIHNRRLGDKYGDRFHHPKADYDRSIGFIENVKKGNV